MEVGKHIVFYDGKCGFCDQVVQFLLKADKNKIFYFAPLQGETAHKLLKKLPNKFQGLDTLVLIENFQTSSPKFYVLGKAVFRILWLLGGPWLLLGWISFLPPFLYDWGYRLVARNRGKLVQGQVCKLPTEEEKESFLP